MESNKKFHRDINGFPAECKAEVRSCPRGGSKEHFNSEQECQAFCDKVNEGIQKRDVIMQKVIKKYPDVFGTKEATSFLNSETSKMLEQHWKAKEDTITDLTIKILDKAKEIENDVILTKALTKLPKRNKLTKEGISFLINNSTIYDWEDKDLDIETSIKNPNDISKMFSGYYERTPEEYLKKYHPETITRSEYKYWLEDQEIEDSKESYQQYLEVTVDELLNGFGVEFDIYTDKNNNMKIIYNKKLHDEEYS